jgi:PPK2 family polyphosphate:nucleotide phosphotransferase
LVPDVGGALHRYRVEPETDVDLSQIDPADLSAFEGGKTEGRGETKRLNARLEGLQELLYAEGVHRLLVVLQAMDTGGKDGTIRHVFDGTNPQGVKVASFKKPTHDELAHDYLWRVHPHTPGNGEIAIFNRSHYEDVLVVRVHNLVPEAVWSRRYDQINEFERRLAEEGTTICKFFLHISKDEQRKRLQARIDDPTKRWKFARGDLAERALWDSYQHAYAAMLSETSTPWAPWWIVPADRKWYRNLVISSVLVETLEGFRMQYPDPEDDLGNVVIT